MFGKAITHFGLMFGEEMEVMHIFQLIGFSVHMETVKMDKINFMFTFLKYISEKYKIASFGR